MAVGGASEPGLLDLPTYTLAILLFFFLLTSTLFERVRRLAGERGNGTLTAGACCIALPGQLFNPRIHPDVALHPPPHAPGSSPTGSSSTLKSGNATGWRRP